MEIKFNINEYLQSAIKSWQQFHEEMIIIPISEELKGTTIKSLAWSHKTS